MSTSTRGGVRNASNGRNTRSAASRRSLTPNPDGLGPAEAVEDAEAHTPPPLLGDVDDPGPVEVREDSEAHTPQPLLGYVSSSCPTAIDWQASRLLCDGPLQKHQLAFDIYWNQAAAKAFFRLSASDIQLSDKPSLTHIYIHISPDRINRLSVHQGPQKIFCKQARTFIFDLSEPPTLVLPQELGEIRAAATPGSTTLDVLDAFCSIATQVHFTLHAQVRSSKLSLHQLQDMATSISSGDVGILYQAADTQSLYGGNGASVTEGKDMLIAALPQEVVRNQENNPDLANLPVQQLYAQQPAARQTPARQTPGQGTRPAPGSYYGSCMPYPCGVY